MKSKIGLLLVTICALPLAGFADDRIRFVEEFALAEDRANVLKKLIPGTEDYYYFHALHYQNVGDLDALKTILGQWAKRTRSSSRRETIEIRQALINYDKDPKGTMEFVRKKLGIHFNHQRQSVTAAPNLPTSLDPKTISREAFLTRALSGTRGLGNLENRALDWVIRDGTPTLDTIRRRDLLSRLSRPDYKNLVNIILDDLKTKESRGFGEFGIHRNLLKTQMDALHKAMPSLLTNGNFIHAYIDKLHPNNDIDWRSNPAEKSAYLASVWEFVSTLSPSQNSLKASTLYHLLDHKRKLGDYNKELFLQYIKLPRAVYYAEPKYYQQHDFRNQLVNFNANYSKVIHCPVVGNDEKLVRDYLMQFFLEEDSWEPYATYLRESYLKPVFAETKILNGLGDQEKWASMLTPSAFQALRDRVDIEFLATNPETVELDSDVKLKLRVKNVKQLIVKVYEINTVNYYSKHHKQIDTSLNLDGLVANEEKTYSYNDEPLLRKMREFNFPSLKGRRGVWVIEFIGNGKSSRALIRKGQLQFISRTGSAGEVFTVLHENNKPVKNPAIRLGARTLYPGDDGTIVVPFSNQPGRQPIVLIDTNADFGSLEYFAHQVESYALHAGFHIDREQLLSRKQAKLIVRPVLKINGNPSSLKLLENPKLTIVSTTLDGVSTTLEVPEIALKHDAETIYEFNVPDRLRSLNVSLTGRVENLSQGKKNSLSSSRSFSINEINQTDEVQDILLSKADDGYALEVLGKNGEPRVNFALSLRVKHLDFKSTYTRSLKTDEKGRIGLGALDDIQHVSAGRKNWTLPNDRHSRTLNLHTKAGEEILIPWMEKSEKPLQSEVSLLEVRNGKFVRDVFGALTIKDAFLRVDDLSPGDYSLFIKPEQRNINIRVTGGEAIEADGHLLSEDRHLQQNVGTPLQITSLNTDKGLTVKLANATEGTRVHVSVTRFVPDFKLYEDLYRSGSSEPYSVSRAKLVNNYLSGRQIGDEYRYIIERRYAKKFPGNMLTRPGLLLNPWVLRSTNTGTQLANTGEKWDGRATGKEAKRKSGEGGSGGRTQSSGNVFDCLDFLENKSVVLANLKPNENGIVQIDAKDLEGSQQIHVIAVNSEDTVFRSTTLPKRHTDFQDIRLAKALDPQKHFTEQRNVSVLKADEKLQLPNLRSSEFATYDELKKAYALYISLTNNSNLIEFSFITSWAKMDEKEKRAKYSEFACHELHLFLYKHDRPFFDKVILPYLANKKDKTFLDDYLLENDLMPYLQAWKYQRLNIVERLLLGKRLGGNEASATARHAADRFDLIPPDIDRENFLFESALRGRSLAVSTVTGMLVPGEATASSVPRRAAEVAKSLGKKQAERIVDQIAEAEFKAEKSDLRMAAKLSETNRFRDEKSNARALQKDAKRRANVRQFYRKLDKTKELAENNYYKIPIARQNADLVKVNAFWNDYAQWNGKGEFRSPNIAVAISNFTEMMCALAVLDFAEDPKAVKAGPSRDGSTFDVTVGSPTIVFHKEVKSAKLADEKTPLLVSQNFFRKDDRYMMKDRQKTDKYVTEEFLKGIVYGGQIVVTNPTSANQKIEILTQIPEKAIPVSQTHYTNSRSVNLAPYTTQKIEIYFYFPETGKFPHYPVHVSRNEEVVAFTKPFVFNVVDKLSRIDKTSWAYISQWGSEKDVIDYLKANNVDRLNLDLIAWKMKEKAFFNQVIALLDARHIYQNTLWSYAIHHNEPKTARQYLLHANGFLNRCGPYLESPLVDIDPIERRGYEHLEYSPLVNARSHPLGRDRRILNSAFHQQYHKLMDILAHKKELEEIERMSVVYYLLLQDRVSEGIAQYEKVNAEELPTKLQHDYFSSYISFYKEEPGKAKAIAEKYADYPVDRWQKLFANVTAQADEIQNDRVQPVDEKDREQMQDQLAASEPSLQLEVANREVTIGYDNVSDVTLNYYKMDLEFLFSTNPFGMGNSDMFAIIKPNETRKIALPRDKDRYTLELPAAYHSNNVLIEVKGSGAKAAVPHYSNSLKVQMIENYGRLEVRNKDTNQPLSKAYVKVYAKFKDGTTKFFKDGYTDLRGKFDYTSLNTNEIDQVSDLSILIMSEKSGAVVKSAKPPKR